MGGSASLIPKDCCEMDGVKCDDHDHITKINWSGHTLRGTIPPEIGILTYLKEL
jgi:hypothetical protein